MQYQKHPIQGKEILMILGLIKLALCCIFDCNKNKVSTTPSFRRNDSVSGSHLRTEFGYHVLSLVYSATGCQWPSLGPTVSRNTHANLGIKTK